MDHKLLVAEFKFSLEGTKTPTKAEEKIITIQVSKEWKFKTQLWQNESIRKLYHQCWDKKWIEFRYSEEVKITYKQIKEAMLP